VEGIIKGFSGEILKVTIIELCFMYSITMFCYCLGRVYINYIPCPNSGKSVAFAKAVKLIIKDTIPAVRLVEVTVKYKARRAFAPDKAQHHDGAFS